MPPVSSKNLGQVAGMFIGQNPPDNTLLLWFDNTPSINCHKIYDFGLQQWIVLSNEIISTITYQELVDIATTIGLSVGRFFAISDQGNILALSHTPTKIQYVDLAGNLVLDDLGTNKIYFVSSGNLSIEDILPTLNEINHKINFVFGDYTPDADDYLLSKVYRNGAFKLGKFKLSSLISTKIGNALSWNGGFFFNFLAFLRNQYDVSGGVASKAAIDSLNSSLGSQITGVSQSLNSLILTNHQEHDAIQDNLDQAVIDINGTISEEVGTLETAIGAVQTNLNDATTNTAIMAKQTAALNDYILMQYVAAGDSIQTAFSKFQRFIKYLRGRVDDLTAQTSDYVYDYIVNSNATLEALNNMQVKSVLIKSGVYTFDFGIFESPTNYGICLDAVQSINCERGVVIIFTGLPFDSDVACFWRTNGNLTLSSNYGKISNLTVLIQNLSIPCVTFKNLINMEFCTVFNSSTLNPTSHDFLNCANLKNCSSSNYSDTGFNNCNYLENCSSGLNLYSSFLDCNNLINCVVNSAWDADTYTLGVKKGFSNCNRLDGCSVEMSIPDTIIITEGSVIGFYQCSDLSKCKSIIMLSGWMIGFSYCKRMNLCSSEVYSITSSETVGARVFAFSHCLQISECFAWAHKNSPSTVHIGLGINHCKVVHGCVDIGDFDFGEVEAANYSYASWMSNQICNDNADGGFNKHFGAIESYTTFLSLLM